MTENHICCFYHLRSHLRYFQKALKDKLHFHASSLLPRHVKYVEMFMNLVSGTQCIALSYNHKNAYGYFLELSILFHFGFGVLFVSLSFFYFYFLVWAIAIAFHLIPVNFCHLNNNEVVRFTFSQHFESLLCKLFPELVQTCITPLREMDFCHTAIYHKSICQSK